MSVLGATAGSSAANGLQLTMGTVATNSSGTSSASDNELSQLVGELTGDITGPDGKLDTGTPLGKMLDDFVKNNLPDGLASQGDPAQSMTKKGVSQALTSMIQDVLGGDSSNSGQVDLKSLILGALGKSKLDSLLTPNPGRDGSNFSTSGVDPQILAQVGQFMDENPDEFPPPDQGASEGQVGGWTGELNANVAGDNFLNHDENAAVTKALGMLGQIMQQGLASPEASSGQNALPGGNGATGSTGGLGTQTTQRALGQLMQEMQAMQQMEQSFEQFEQAAQGAGSSQDSSSTGGTSTFDQLMSFLNQGASHTHSSHHSFPLQASAQDTSSKILNNLFG